MPSHKNVFKKLDAQQKNYTFFLFNITNPIYSRDNVKVKFI